MRKHMKSQGKKPGILIGKMEWKFIGACILLIWAGETNSLGTRSNLCRPNRSYTPDCTHQMGVAQARCSAIIERNNTVCWDMNFPSWSKPNINKKHFKLRTYCYNDGAYQRTGLNVTINSGSWTEAAFRFKIEGMNYVSCVQFIHNASINDNFMLFYDCIWHENDLYGEQMKADYYLKDQNRDTVEFGSLHFILPQCHFNAMGEHDLDISRHQTFIYVDEKASSFSTVHIQKMPVDYQISTYIMKKCHTCESDLNKEVECSKAYCTTEEKVKTDINDEEIVLKVPYDRNETCFYLTVEAVCHNCSTSNWCVARSVLLIPSKTGVSAIPFIVVLLCFVTVLALSCTYFIKKHRTGGDSSYTRPKVLFVYNPVHNVHVQIIVNIVKLMRHYYGIDVFFAETDIASTMNPLGWYNNAVSEAHYVAVVSALSCFNNSTSTYNNIFHVGMTCVEETIKNNPKGIKIFNIIFPYNLENDVPDITKCYKHFCLMKEFDDMIIHVHKNVNCGRGQHFKLKVHKRMDGWVGCKSLPDYSKLCKNIENMKKIVVQEENVCLNTIEDNFSMITFSERLVSAPASDVAEHVTNIAEGSVPAPANNIAECIINEADVPMEDSRNDLDQEFESLQELLQNNELRAAFSRRTTDSDSEYRVNKCASTRNAFVTSADKFLDLGELL